MLSEVFICYVVETHAHGEPQNGSRTVLTFIASGDHGNACFLAGAAADQWFDGTGVPVGWHVDTLPYVGRMAEGQLLRWATDQANEDGGKRA